MACLSACLEVFAGHELELLDVFLRPFREGRDAKEWEWPDGRGL